MGVNWLEIWQPPTGKERKRRQSLYRERKESSHTTINGRGTIARLGGKERHNKHGGTHSVER